MALAGTEIKHAGDSASHKYDKQTYITNLEYKTPPQKTLHAKSISLDRLDMVHLKIAV